MFSYRHAFHAGNHADVLKHLVLQQIIAYMVQKDTPLTYIDTHAGAGLYQLDGEYAQRSGEAETGVARLFALAQQGEKMPPMLDDYLALVRGMNPPGRLRYYPGSPFWAEKLLRADDRLRLFELHNSDIKLLLDNVYKTEQHARAQGVRIHGKRTLVQHADGFEGVKALLPPPSRRALVLIDPPYEDKQDYSRVKRCLNECIRRFTGGTYAVWYPILVRQESRQLVTVLQQLPGIEWLHVSLSIAAQGPDGTGLSGSGMFIINPPWTLEAALRQQMPEITRLLAQDNGAHFEVVSGVGRFDSTRAQPVADADDAPLARAGARNAAGPRLATAPRNTAGFGSGPRNAGAAGPRSTAKPAGNPASGPRKPGGMGARNSGAAGEGDPRTRSGAGGRLGGAGGGGRSPASAPRKAGAGSGTGAQQQARPAQKRSPRTPGDAVAQAYARAPRGPRGPRN